MNFYNLAIFIQLYLVLFTLEFLFNGLHRVNATHSSGNHQYRLKRGCRGGKRKQRKITTITGHRPVLRPSLPRPPSTLSDVIRVSTTQTQQVDLNIYHLNCQSCREKTFEIHDLLLERNIDILFITESWLRPDGDEPIIAAITPPGFIFKSFPRENRIGGGIAVVYKSELSRKITTNAIIKYQSMQVVQTRFSSNSDDLNFICVYRPPPSKNNRISISTVRNDFNDLISTAGSQPGHPIILGDLNFHFDNTAAVAKITDIIDQNDMQQIVCEPTHRDGHIIDCVIIKNSFTSHCKTNVLYIPFSDHNLIEIFINIIRPEKIKREISTRDIKNINIVNFKNDLSSDLTGLNTITAEQWNNKILNVLDKHAPVKCRYITNRSYAPWYSAEVRCAKNACRQSERKFRKHKSDSSKEVFRHHFQKWKKVVRQAKAAYFLNKFENTNSCKQLFGICDELLGRKKCNSMPNNIDIDDLPNSFSRFFDHKVKDIRSRLDNFDSFVEHDTFVGRALEGFEPVTEDYIRHLISRAPIKSCELDPLPANLLAACVDVLVPSITIIMNSSLLSGDVPSCFKSALVHPLLKKPSLDQNDLKNYRPVSNLPFLSKLLEKVILEQLKDHLLSNCLEEPFQSAYRQHHCTETALLKVFNDLTVNAMSNEINILCLLDLSAAFDTIDHGILLTRLEKTFGIKGDALKWFSSYLNERWQSTVIGGVKSHPYPLEFGVPQGSVLGPVLFTIYMQPLSNVIKQFFLNYHFYADDTQIYGSTNIDDIHNLIIRIENCFIEIKRWMNGNKLLLNDVKTEVMMCGRKDVCKNVHMSSIALGDNRVAFTPHVKNLGVFIDCDLKMSQQVNYLIKSIYIVLSKIRRIRHLIPTNIAELLVNALILSKLDYCNSLFANMSKNDFKCLQVVQNNCARLIFKKRRFDSASPLLRDLHWLPVEKRVEYKICMLVYKSLNSDGPSYINDLLTEYVPSRNLRSSLDKTILTPPKIVRKIGQQSFLFSAPQFWNSLPGHIRRSETLSTFKSRLKTYLFTS